MAVQFGEPGDLGPLGRVIIWESEEAANHASLFEEVQARSGCSALMTHCFQVICEFFCKFA